MPPVSWQAAAPSAWALNPRGLHPGQFAPWGSWSPVGTVQDRPSRQARLAAERRACAREKRTCAPGAGCPLRHAFGMTPPPKGEARLGSPFGGAVAARRLRGQLASASTQPMRRGRWHLALSALLWRAPPPRGEARLSFAQALWRRTYLAPPLGAATSRWDVAQRPTEAAAETLARREP